jgi:hypothetical protein
VKKKTDIVNPPDIIHADVYKAPVSVWNVVYDVGTVNIVIEWVGGVRKHVPN